MLILDMQFLWLYVDDLMGKGLEWNIILELLLYASANWVPLALPLSVLLASIMSFGSLGEKNELLALKAAGISLFKIMRPLIVVVFMIAVFAFYFTNNLWPVANFKMRVLLRDIQNTKVALVLQPGVFFKSDNSIKIKRFVVVISKWAMVDVFVVGLFVAYLSAQASGNLSAVLEPGFYYFTGYCLVSLLAMQLMKT